MSMTHDITSAVPRYKKTRRKGRGEGSGSGKTAGRGTKGSGAHGGDVHWVRGREGGQTPLFKRFPKRGFSNFNFERKYYVVNLSALERFDSGTTVDAASLIEAGLVPDDRMPVKVLGEGELTKKLTISVDWYSRSAHQKITSLGGTAQNARGEAFEFPKPKKKFEKRETKKAKPEKTEAEGDAAKPDAEKPETKARAPKSEPTEGGSEAPAAE